MLKNKFVVVKPHTQRLIYGVIKERKRNNDMEKKVAH